MAKIQKSALLEAPVELAYQVVQGVEVYPEFLPGCTRVEVLSRNDTEVEAKVVVQAMGLTVEFVTTNQHSANAISMTLKRGPFRTLEGMWHFRQIGDTGCRVEIDIEFEIDGGMAVLFVPIADKVANKMVDAFCRRIENVQIGGASLGAQG